MAYVESPTANVATPCAPFSSVKPPAPSLATPSATGTDGRSALGMQKHRSEAVDPVPAVYVSPLQEMQAASSPDPPLLWYRPRGQLIHALGDVDPLAGLYLPAAQPLQDLDVVLCSWNCPLGQATQAPICIQT